MFQRNRAVGRGGIYEREKIQVPGGRGVHPCGAAACIRAGGVRWWVRFGRGGLQRRRRGACGGGGGGGTGGASGGVSTGFGGITADDGGNVLLSVALATGGIALITVGGLA